MLDPRTCNTLLIYGGSFDPPHRAHVELPLAAMRAARADGILYVPAGQPPHKPDQPLTPAHHRLAMLRLALADQPHSAIDTFELDRDEPSYTVETLEHLRDTLGPRVNLRLLIGADMAAIFHTWRSPDRILQLAEPLVMLREGIHPESLGPQWTPRIVPVPRIDIASRQLRALIHHQRWDDPILRENLDPGVLAYAKNNRLYT